MWLFVQTLSFKVVTFVSRVQIIFGITLLNSVTSQNGAPFPSFANATFLYTKYNKLAEFAKYFSNVPDGLFAWLHQDIFVCSTPPS